MLPLVYQYILIKRDENQGEGSAGKSNCCTEIRTKSSNHHHPHKNTTCDYDSELGIRQKYLRNSPVGLAETALQSQCSHLEGMRQYKKR